MFLNREYEHDSDATYGVLVTHTEERLEMTYRSRVMLFEKKRLPSGFVQRETA